MQKGTYVKFETPESLEKSALDLVENSFRSGKIKKGTNEVIKWTAEYHKIKDLKKRSAKS